MNASIIKFDYNGNQIPFEKGDDVMVNLTAMAKAYPEKKKAIVFYVLLTLAAVVCFTLQFI